MNVSSCSMVGLRNSGAVSVMKSVQNWPASCSSSAGGARSTRSSSKPSGSRGPFPQAPRRPAPLTGMGILIVTARGLPEDRLRGLSIGVDDYIVKPFEPDLLLARVRAALRRIQQMRSLSPLPGLPGTVVIEQEIRRRLDRGDGFALLYADLDSFKALNDTQGWDVGNRVILAAARVLDAVLPRFAGADGFVGHIGGGGVGGVGGAA